MLALKITAFIVWLYAIWVLRRTELHFFKFLIGSVGLFFFLMFWVQPLVTEPLKMAVTAVAGILGNVTEMYDSFYQYSILFITKNKNSVSLTIN